jgi:hypothetical protein
VRQFAWLLLLCACEPRVTSLGAWLPPRDAGEVDASQPETDAAPPERGQYIEAEDAELQGDYRAASDPLASGDQFLAAPEGVTADAAPGPARASYRFDVERAATYLIWVRMRGPDAEHNRFWFQLDDEPFRKMRLSTGDIWYWDPLHDDTRYDRPLEFVLSAGTHTLRIANCVDGTDIDRLYVTAAGDTPPGNTTACHPPHSIERAGVCLDSCGSHGRTSCGGPVCQGRTVVDAYDCAVCCLIE